MVSRGLDVPAGTVGRCLHLNLRHDPAESHQFRFAAQISNRFPWQIPYLREKDRHRETGELPAALLF